jgi:hypothetical protein
MFFAFLKPIDDHIPAAKLGSLTSLELTALRTPVMLEAATLASAFTLRRPVASD